VRLVTPPVVVSPKPLPGRLYAWWGFPVVAAVAFLCLAALVGITVGKAALPATLPFDMAAARLGMSNGTILPPHAETILLEIRLPRIVLAGLVGGALAVAGATYQALFRNPLADPYLLGIASGAGLGAVLAFILPMPFGLSRTGGVQVMAFLVALVTVAAVYTLARVGRSVPATTLLLAGVAIGAVANAATAYLMYIRGDQLLVIYAWLLGGFNAASWHQVRVVAPLVVVSAVAMVLGGRTMNVLQFGEEQAAALGVRVERARLILVVVATLATAGAVSASGLIGFVGLVVPHMTRLLFGADYRQLLPTAALLGAAFLIMADTGARSLPGPSEVPVGIVTAAIGAPFFLILLRRQKRAAFW
jgi:iron complex transport system permease protein